MIRCSITVVFIEKFVLLNESTLFCLARNSQVSFSVRHHSYNHSHSDKLSMHNIFQSLDPFPSFYVVLLESLDGLGNNLRINITVRRSNEMISLTMEDVLPPKSLWNASILAYGCETHTAVTELSEVLKLKA